jgi:hypothetical protein
MASRQKVSQMDENREDDRGRFWEPPEKRDVISEAGRKWQEENAEAIRQWREWVEKNGVPLAKYRQF